MKGNACRITIVSFENRMGGFFTNCKRICAIAGTLHHWCGWNYVGIFLFVSRCSCLILSTLSLSLANTWIINILQTQMLLFVVHVFFSIWNLIPESVCVNSQHKGWSGRILASQNLREPTWQWKFHPCQTGRTSTNGRLSECIPMTPHSYSRKKTVRTNIPHLEAALNWGATYAPF